ncbi:hypothetical protein CSOJ01_09713 [Colletotrichum sojae]|uniref:Uncharacterized protein n=1 Tax=Colletotrichum sojae TaxID=2175907 RepID=A0A8H6J384_9PEZI|nr:hypothetical protein CSOJ01_09713 [Colletotrichum sojae]
MAATKTYEPQFHDYQSEELDVKDLHGISMESLAAAASPLATLIALPLFALPALLLIQLRGSCQVVPDSPWKIAGSVADASATGAELRSSVSRSEHVTGLGAGLDIQRR